MTDGVESSTWRLDLQKSNGPLGASTQQSIPGTAKGFLPHGAKAKTRHLEGRLAIDWDAIAQFMMTGMPSQDWIVSLSIEDGPAQRQVLVKQSLVPPYGAYLLVEGSELDVAINASKPSRVTIDRIATCEARN